MVFQGAPDIFVGGANLLGFVQGIQKLRSKLCPAQRRRCFDKVIQCRGVLLPKLVLLLTAAWHVSMMQQSVRGLRGRVVMIGRLHGHPNKKAPAFRPGLS